MRSLLLLLSLIGLALAAAPRGSIRYNPGRDAQILSYENEIEEGGNYRYRVVQSDGTEQEARSELRNAGREDEFLSVVGSYSWVGPDDLAYTVKYSADDERFKPEIQQPPGGAVPLAKYRLHDLKITFSITNRPFTGRSQRTQAPGRRPPTGAGDEMSTGPGGDETSYPLGYKTTVQPAIIAKPQSPP
ncbi:Flexible cuticle protein 12 [Eumeta japonica]|uniref:Flexible cuticle protein 12 n=1 Tax=Eumeta variegata TaxID=151549 RepID=A0A4C1YBU7_EUMVA|nr:Flexible cuticle protein 12 [Eumeta japonica]